MRLGLKVWLRVEVFKGFLKVAILPCSKILQILINFLFTLNPIQAFHSHPSVPFYLLYVNIVSLPP